MATKLFVGGLPYSVNDDELRDFFAQFGTVASAQVIIDRAMNRSKGFGFVEFESEDEANAAIEGSNGKEMSGRSITVNIAKPKEDRPRNSFGGGAGGRPSNGGSFRGGFGGGGNRY